MKFNTLALLSVLGLAAAAPIEERQFTSTSANGAAALGFCGEEASNNFNNGILPHKIQDFCRKANQLYGGSPHSDIGDNYYLSIDDSQGGSYEPCWQALSWIYQNCAVHGKVGQYQTNANIYKFDHN